MPFLKIADPARRDQTVKEFLAIKKNIRDNELAEKTGKIELRTDLSEFFKPITETQKATTEEITSTIKEGIELLPKRLPQRLPARREAVVPLSPPPAYAPEISGVFPGSDIKFGIYSKGGEFFIGDKLAEVSEDQKSIIIAGKKRWGCGNFLHRENTIRMLKLAIFRRTARF